MVTTRSHLSTLRPSPTTVSFTVSTASRRKTLASQLIHYFLLFLRIVLGFATLAILIARTFDDFDYLPVSWSKYIDKAPWSHVGPLAFASFFLVFRRFHTGSSEPLLCIRTFPDNFRVFFAAIYFTDDEANQTFVAEESLLILRSLGIQTSTLSPSYLLPSNTRFIPTSQIRDIFIHEAFRGFEVKYYLAVIVEEEGEVVVVFPVSE